MEPVTIRERDMVVTSAGPDAWLCRKTAPDPGRSTMTGDVHEVLRLPFGGWLCTCRGFEIRKVCCHVKGVQTLLGECDDDSIS